MDNTDMFLHYNSIEQRFDLNWSDFLSLDKIAITFNAYSINIVVVINTGAYGHCRV